MWQWWWMAALVAVGEGAVVVPPRGPFGLARPKRNATGVFVGGWAVDGGKAADLAPLGVCEYGIDGAGATVAGGEGGALKEEQMEEAVGLKGVGWRAARVYNGGGDEYRGAELTLSSAPEAPQLVHGLLTLSRGVYVRKYTVRGALVGEALRMMLVPKGLQHLVQSPHLAPDRLAPSALTASYSITKFVNNATMWFRQPPPANATCAAGAPLLVQRVANASLKAVYDGGAGTEKDVQWGKTVQELHADRCVWFGELRMVREDMEAVPGSGALLPARGLHREVGYAFTGRLVSLTCQRSLDLTVSHAALAQGQDAELAVLAVGLAVTVLHAAAVQAQLRYGVAQSAAHLARTSWGSFLLLGVVEWSLAETHWGVLNRMPDLLHMVLALSFFHLMTLHLTARQAYNALDAARGRVLVLPVASLPLSLIAWAAANRSPGVWVPCLVLTHSLWVPQIVHSARSRSPPPIAPALLVTTVVSRLFYTGHDLLWSSVLVPHAPQRGVFLGLAAWLLFQTGVLVLQTRLGPCFFLPGTMARPAYDYHRPLAQGDAPAVLHGGARKRSASAHPAVRDVETGAGAPQPPDPAQDCVICQAPIDATKPWNYMMPPCGHLFHADCLKEWMQYKMECPVCRGPLPPHQS